MLDAVLVILIVVVTLVLFGLEKLRADVVAIVVLSLLMVVGLFRPAFPDVTEALSGFSHPATVTIAAMFILGAGLTRTGVVNHLTRGIVGLAGGKAWLAIALLMLTVGLVSSFVSNTATVAVFLPITLALSRECKVPVSHTMMPLSFMAMAGGTVTVIGTSTNVVVAQFAATHGLGALPLFAPAPLGFVFLLLSLAYVTLIARRLLPANDDTTGLTQKYRLSNYLSTLVVRPGSPLIGQSPLETRLRERYGIDVLQIARGDEERWFGIRDTRLLPEDRLLVRGDAHEILRLKELGLTPAGERRFADRDLASEATAISEALVPPGSELIGSSIRDADFRRRYGVFVLALRKHGKTLTSGIVDTPLEAGDTLLLQGRRDAIEGYAEHPDFIVLREVSVPQVRRGHAVAAAVIMGLVIVSSGSGLLPILPAALLGSLAMVLTGCLHVKEAHESIDWMVIFLLGGMFPLGAAIEKSGVDDMIAAGIGHAAAALGPAAVVPVMFAGATILTSFISNAACAVLLSPIALATATHLGVSPWPLLLSIMFGSSMAFATPVGYQTNLMVYGAGGYRFMDFVRAGLPLAILFWIVGSLLIPVLWPLHP
ncbi:MAG: SLC13 family permease [bacterium]